MSRPGPYAWQRLSQEQEAALWADYKLRGTAAPRNTLVEYFMPFAKMLAAKLYGKRGQDDIEFGDYLQLASLGLIDAIGHYRPELNIPFTAYASHRINGAMMDGVEGYTERLRQLAVQRKIKARIESIAADGQRDSGDIASAFERIAAVAVGLAVGMMLEGDGLFADEMTPSPHTPYGSVELAQLKQQVIALVEKLPEREASVIRGHYFHQLPLDAIAQLQGLSKGRISQIHQAGLRLLREQIRPLHQAGIAW